VSRALVSQVPAGLAALSAIAYFACSEGVRNHVLLLWHAARMLGKLLR
jgi:hypothetical protein